MNRIERKEKQRRLKTIHIESETKNHGKEKKPFISTYLLVLIDECR